MSVAAQTVHATSGQPNLREVQRKHHGLLLAGGIIMGVSCFYSIFIGTAFTLIGEGGAAWTLLIPVVGGTIWPATDDRGWHDTGILGDVLGLPAAGLQLLGLILTIIGATTHETAHVSVASGAHPGSLAPELTAGPGDIGVGLRWSM